VRSWCACSSRPGTRSCPVLTPAAEGFISYQTLNALARRSGGAGPYPHLEHADLFVIAPATANTLAKLAGGIADNLVTSPRWHTAARLSWRPAMNARMWANPATQENMRVLRERGARTVGPEGRRSWAKAAAAWEDERARGDLRLLPGASGCV